MSAPRTCGSRPGYCGRSGSGSGSVGGWAELGLGSDIGKREEGGRSHCAQDDTHREREIERERRGRGGREENK
jgi:hypothetical protein